MSGFWDAYDAERRPLGTLLIRGEPIPKGQYHLVVNAWVMDGAGRLLLSQRHPDKPFGLMWECTGGSTLAGETSLQGVQRELSEELGLCFPPERFQLLGSWRRENDFVDHYLVMAEPGEAEREKLVLQPEEVVDARWVEMEEYDALCAAGEVPPTILNLRALLAGRIPPDKEIER